MRAASSRRGPEEGKHPPLGSENQHKSTAARDRRMRATTHGMQGRVSSGGNSHNALNEMGKTMKTWSAFCTCEMSLRVDRNNKTRRDIMGYGGRHDELLHVTFSWSFLQTKINRKDYCMTAKKQRNYVSLDTVLLGKTE